MFTILINKRHKSERYFFIIITILLSTILLDTDMVSPAHAYWFGLRDEPKLISVSGTLANPSSIKVEVEVNGSKELLLGHQARAFLYLRSYINFDDTAMKWHTTDKYKAWKENPQKGPPPQFKTKYYSPGGPILSKCPTVNGLRHGVEIIYFKDGQIRARETFRNGKQEGPYERFVKNKDGKASLKETGIVKNGSKTNQKWY